MSEEIVKGHAHVKFKFLSPHRFIGINNRILLVLHAGSNYHALGKFDCVWIIKQFTLQGIYMEES